MPSKRIQLLTELHFSCNNIHSLGQETSNLTYIERLKYESVDLTLLYIWCVEAYDV
jgi:hypothetical protein